MPGALPFIQPPGQTTPQGIPGYPMPPQGIPGYPPMPPTQQPGMAPFLGQAQPSVTQMGTLTSGQQWPPAARKSGGRRRVRRNVAESCILRTVLTILPNTGTASMVVPVTITGTGFQAGDAVTVSRGLARIEVTNVVIIDSNNATADLTVDESVALGAYDVQVGPDNCALPLEGGFTVT